MVKLERIFKDTREFEGNQRFPFAKPFAKSLEWLYDESVFSKAEEQDEAGGDWKIWPYYLGSTISLCDLLNIEICIISRAGGEFALAELNDFMTLIAGKEIKNIFAPDITLKHDGDYLIVGDASQNVLVVLLWGAYVYWRFRSELEPEKKIARRAMDVLYKLFAAKTCLDDGAIQELILMKNLHQSIFTMAKYCHTKSRSKQDQKPSDGKRDNEADTRIKELTQENEALKKKCQLAEQELEELRAQTPPPPDETTIDEIAIELLAPLFADKTGDAARAFYSELSGKDDIGVADVVVSHKEDYSPRMRDIDLWRILHAFKKYNASDRNFATALRKHNFRGS